MNVWENCKRKYWCCLKMSSPPWKLIDISVGMAHDVQQIHCALSLGETTKATTFPLVVGLQPSFRTDVGLTQCSTGRKRVLQHICETTGISKGYSRANTAPESTCNAHFVPEKVARVGCVSLAVLTLQQRQWWILPTSSEVRFQTHGATSLLLPVPYWNCSPFNHMPL